MSAHTPRPDDFSPAATIEALQEQRDALVTALQAALPMLDAWLNGDGTNIDMNEWDAATMLARAALARATGVQS